MERGAASPLLCNYIQGLASSYLARASPGGLNLTHTPWTGLVHGFFHHFYIEEIRVL